MPGDVVRRLIRGCDTQRGYCRGVSVRASVEILGTKQVSQPQFRNVSCKGCILSESVEWDWYTDNTLKQANTYK